VTRRWLFLLAAALPCLVLLAFCAISVQEWWLIRTQQIAVIPRPQPGQTEAIAVPAAHLVPWMLGSGALAVTFAYALLRRSTRALVAGYLVLLLVVGAAVARRL
jgi:hypothetical protein